MHDNDTMYFKSIASGSKGNATLLWDSDTLLIFDFGISIKRLNENLGMLGIGEKMVSTFISHEHADHSSGIKSLIKKMNPDVYTRAATADALKIKSYEIQGGVTIGNFEVIDFSVPHDAADPVGFSVIWYGKKISIVSDLGTVTAGIIKEIKDSDILSFEANHDIEMLKHGRYPYPLKKRIMSDTGHLSNEQSAEAIGKVLHEDTEIILSHISQQNNTPEIACSYVQSYLDNRNLQYRSIECADQDRGSFIHSIKK